MKAVVVDIHGNQAAVLCKDGTVEKIKNRDYQIGMEVNYSKVHYLSSRCIAMAASLALFFLIGGTFAFGYYSPYAYVTVDVNPSIEYVLNRFNKVIQVKAYNNEGSDILESVAYDTGAHSDIEDTLKSTIKQLYNQKYIGKDEDFIVIATAAKSEKRNKELSAMSDQLINDYRQQDENTQVTSEIFEVTPAEETAASDMGTTMGRVELVKKAADNYDQMDEEELKEWLSKPIPELVASTNATTNENTIVVEDEEENDDTQENQGSNDTLTGTTSTDNSQDVGSIEPGTTDKNQGGTQVTTGSGTTVTQPADTTTGTDASTTTGSGETSSEGTDNGTTTPSDSTVTDDSNLNNGSTDKNQGGTQEGGTTVEEPGDTTVEVPGDSTGNSGFQDGQIVEPPVIDDDDIIIWNDTYKGSDDSVEP